MSKTLKTMFVAVMVLAAPGLLQAQYAIDMVLDNTSYLQFESMEARVTIRNDTDHMLLLGGLRETAVMEFKIIRNSETVTRRTKGLLVENVLVMPGQTKDITIDLGRHYNIQSLGQYLVSATFSLDGTKFQTSPRVVDVVPGLELDSTLRSVLNQPASMRKYSLKYWSRKDREMLFLCVIDEKEGVNYGVFMLGPIVRVFPPELSVDVAGNVQIKHQADNGVFAYTTLKSTVDGVALVRQEVKTSEVKLPGGRKPAK